MEYRVIRSGDRSDYLEHAIFGGGRQKGAQNKNHKYLARAWWKNKWRYAYTEAEVRALQMLGRAKSAVNDTKEKVQETAAKAKTTAQTAKSVVTGQYSKDVEKKASNAKQNIVRATEEKNKAQAQAKAAAIRQDKYSGGLHTVFKAGKEKASNAGAAQARAEQNAANAEKSRQKYQAELASAARERESTAYKVSEGVNQAKAKASETAEKLTDTAKNASKSAKEAVAKVSETAKKAADIATGKYVNDVDTKRAKAEENYDRTQEALNKELQSLNDARNRRNNNRSFVESYLGKDLNKKSKNASDTMERKLNNIDKLNEDKKKHLNEIEKADEERASNAYKVSNAVNNTKEKVSETAKNVADKASSVAEKGKAKAEEILSGMKKTDKQSGAISNDVSSSTRSSGSEATRGRKYEGTGHKAEARKEEGGVAGGPVSGNTNMQGRGEEKKTSLKDKVSDLAKKASNAAEAVKLGAHLTKKNVENYLNDDNGKVVTDTAGKSTLKGQKVTTTYSEGNGLLNKSTLTKKQNEDGTVEYEHHTEYGKIAQTAKKGKEAVENLFGDKKTPKYSITPKKLEEYTPPWLEGYHFKNGKMEVDKSVAETFEKGKSKAKEVLDKVSSTAKTTADKVKDKVTDTAEKVADKVEDIKVNAEHKAYANEMKRKYGADSLHYKDAQAYVEHDKTVSDLQKARDKYGVNSSEYKAAAAKEKAAREKMDDVHEQNLYTNNKEYKKVSDQANALGSYIRNMDARGGPQTAEGKANYRKAVRDLEKLEAELERMWNEDWE